MQITLNQQVISCSSVQTLQELLQQHKISTDGVAVALNNTVIARRLWPEVTLNSGDDVQLFQIVTGG
ncbi:sulfur carrier protein ThiS [Chromatiaceae bacterium AAb-1]|nr:sulfur carrier protein ThiS [Chromatiaceae bacterium AAb-1]